MAFFGLLPPGFLHQVIPISQRGKRTKEMGDRLSPFFSLKLV
jgi:hypothetical protein